MKPNLLHKPCFMPGINGRRFAKPQVGIVSMGYEGNPCNMHLNDLAKEVKSRCATRKFSRFDIQYHWRK